MQSYPYAISTPLASTFAHGNDDDGRPPTHQKHRYILLALSLISLFLLSAIYFHSPSISEDDIYYTHPFERPIEEWTHPLLPPSTTEREEIGLSIDESSHYRFPSNETEPKNDRYTKLIEQEFDLLLPREGLSLNLSSEKGKGMHTLAFAHQLWCLDILRQDYAYVVSLSSQNLTHSLTLPLSTHCLSYLRSSLLCHADTQLEPLYAQRDPPVLVNVPSMYSCRDWRGIYNVLREGL